VIFAFDDHVPVHHHSVADDDGRTVGALKIEAGLGGVGVNAPDFLAGPNPQPVGGPTQCLLLVIGEVFEIRHLLPRNSPMHLGQRITSSQSGKRWISAKRINGHSVVGDPAIGEDQAVHDRAVAEVEIQLARLPAVAGDRSAHHQPQLFKKYSWSKTRLGGFFVTVARMVLILVPTWAEAVTE